MKLFPIFTEFKLSGECMLLGSVSSQERFGVTDIKAPLGVSQLLGLGQTVLQLSGLEWTIIALRQISVIAPCYSSILFRRQQENPSSRREGMSIQRRKGKSAPVYRGERERALWLLFLYVFFVPLGLPYANWA